MLEGVSVNTAIGLSLQTGLEKDIVKIFLESHQEPDIDALGKANSNISSGLIVVGAAVAKDLDVDPSQLLVFVHRGLVLGQVGQPLPHSLKIALKVQDNAHLNRVCALKNGENFIGLSSLKKKKVMVGFDRKVKLSLVSQV